MEDVKRRFAEYKRQQQRGSELPAESSAEGEAGPQGEDKTLTDTNDDNLSHEPPRHTSAQTPTEVDQAPLPPPPPPTPLYVTLLKLLLWGLVWGFFIEVGFGAVFFITSLLYLLVTSLRGSRRRPWEPSAYSVFNRNCEAIEGTLSAEQFERELRYGPMSVRK